MKLAFLPFLLLQGFACSQVYHAADPDAVEIVAKLMSTPIPGAEKQPEEEWLPLSSVGPDGGTMWDLRTSGGHLRRMQGEESCDTPVYRETNTNPCTKLVAESTGWKNFLEEVVTFQPVFRPKTDNELNKIIKQSKKCNCKVRMSGASHSEDGMVIQRREEAVVIHLVDHETYFPGWGDSLDKNTGRARIGAGRSWYDLAKMARAEGFVVPSRTAGRLFSIGGVVANMVHGGGRNQQFVHDDVTALLVLTADAKFQEITGDDLKYWRSSAGLLGIIVAVELQLRSESVPFVAADQTLDEGKGGLHMQTSNDNYMHLVLDPATLIKSVTERVYQLHATTDAVEFFYLFYSNELLSYYTDFSGPRFSGRDGDFADENKADAYQAAADALSEAFPDAGFTGGAKGLAINDENACEILCVPPTGPLGDGSTCNQIPSQLVQGALACNVPLEKAAIATAASGVVQTTAWEQSKASINDGYWLTTPPATYETLIVATPLRAFAQAFGTFLGIMGKAVLGELGFEHFPFGNLEFRFIAPQATATLNPIPTAQDFKEEFDNANFLGAFDRYFPLPPGVPDGI